MDSQGQEIAEAAVIGGDCRFGRVYFEKFVYGSSFSLYQTFKTGIATACEPIPLK
jgi:hypothetical protein